MEFAESLKEFSKRVASMKENIQTEEATKMSFIVPFFQLLGYDIFNPTEFCPEFTADVGIKKGEKVDYAIMKDGLPAILIECKSCTDILDRHTSQLYRYFGTTKAKFGILTNGLVYKFYTDLDELNKMDLQPFMEFDILNIKDSLIPQVKKFCKESFNEEQIFDTASDLKYTNLIREYLSSEFNNPSDDFVKLVLSSVYNGQKNQKAIERFKPLVKLSYTAFINETVNQRISSALAPEAQTEPEKKTTPVAGESEPESKIVTTPDEIEAFYIVRGILAGIIPIEDIVHRDTESYFGILYKDNNRKPICRISLDHKIKYLYIPDENKNFTKYTIESLNDIYKFKDKLIEAASQYKE